MAREEIRGFNNQIIGFVETDNNGNKTVRGWNNQIVAYYRKSDNTTRGWNNQIICTGDAAVAELFKPQKK